MAFAVVPQAERLSHLKTQSEDVASQIGCQVASVEGLSFQDPIADLAATYHVQFDGCSMGDEKLKQALALWEDMQGIKEVEAEAVVRSSEDTVKQDDPLRAKQYYLQTIHRDEACRSLALDKVQPVIVAVVDTGVDSDHPDLVDSFLRDANGKIIGANFVGKGSKGAADDQWDDQRGHGTHVAGLIAATALNAKGVAGVASCVPIKIMPIRVLGSNATPGSLTLSTYPGGTYKNMSGTSMAAPIAAGSYALVLSGLRKSKIERFRYGDVYPLMTKATGAGKFNKDDVVSQGVLDVHKLLVTARAKLVPEPQDETPQPEKPAPETPQEPLEPLVPEPPMNICSFQP
ncbi:MAG TPA: S8 family serine peptidase [Oligoflexus sp.]|uniref:S8 family serine peptidase n=1 Tax=Oligoflexus sp. TaxID=1971216 RepID=UPI002D757A25|nr:S8 family serine peptidase [Oligoflexus sp.]HYX31625.1 S8 family serine peptidase [Oligoflexus sp.]